MHMHTHAPFMFCLIFLQYFILRQIEHSIFGISLVLIGNTVAVDGCTYEAGQYSALVHILNSSSRLILY